MSRITALSIREEVNQLLRHSLTDYALLSKNKEMFKNLQSDEWKEHLVRADIEDEYMPRVKNIDWEYWENAVNTLKSLKDAGLIEEIKHYHIFNTYMKYFRGEM